MHPTNANNFEGYDPMFSLKMDNFDIFDGKELFISNHFHLVLPKSSQFPVCAPQDRYPCIKADSLGISLSPEAVQLSIPARRCRPLICQLYLWFPWPFCWIFDETSSLPERNYFVIKLTGAANNLPGCSCLASSYIHRPLNRNVLMMMLFSLQCSCCLASCPLSYCSVSKDEEDEGLSSAQLTITRLTV